MCFRSRLVALTTAVLILTRPTASFAWNYTGHRVIALIAYRQLDAQTRRRVAEVLRKHPAYEELWANRPTNGPDQVLNLLWNASVFPDDARSEPWKKYGRSAAHYVNYRILAEKGRPGEAQPVPGENILKLILSPISRRLGIPKTSDDERALHLSWVFHQVGDIHMPLHAVARFSKAPAERRSRRERRQGPEPEGETGVGHRSFYTIGMI